jgi:hypothetical protein
MAEQFATRRSMARCRRTQRVRQAAVGLVSGAAFFVLLQLGLALAIEAGLTDWRDPPYEYRLHQMQRRLRAAPPRPALVVALGSSRTLMGLRGLEASRSLSTLLGRPVVVMNFARSGAGPLLELLTLRRLRDDGIRPDLLLVEVLPPALNAADPPVELGEVRLPTERLRWKDLAFVERYSGVRRELRQAWRRGWPLAWYTHRVSLLSALVPGLVPQAHRLTARQDLDASGSIRDPEGSWSCKDRQQATQAAFCEYAGVLAGHRLGGPTCAALHELLFAARRDGIATALILMPEGPLFRSWYPVSVRGKVDRWLANVAQQHGVPLIDTRTWFDDSAFWDSHHLRPTGAEHFTRRLSKEVLLPLLVQQPRSPSRARSAAE